MSGPAPKRRRLSDSSWETVAVGKGKARKRHPSARSGHHRQGTHLYDAVSYVWGPPPNTHHIIVDNKFSVLVRENCHGALCRLRDPFLPKIVWVDSVCINQQDNDEKTAQVQMMTMVYASAERVTVWLEEPGGGEESRQNSRKTLQAIGAAAAHKDGAAALRIPWYADLMVETSRSWEGPLRSSILLIKGTITRPKAISVDDTAENFSLSLMPLPELINLYGDRHATDPRDKAYALLGMSSLTPAGIVPDYNSTWTSGAIDRQDMKVQLIRARSTVDWSIQALANPILKGDLVCLLDGTSKPSIIRKDETYEHFLIICIDTPAMNVKEKFEVDCTRIGRSGFWKAFSPVELTLVWDWSIFGQASEEHGQRLLHLDLVSSSTPGPRTLKDTVSRPQNLGKLLAQLGKSEDAADLLWSALGICQEACGVYSLEATTAMETTAEIFHETGQYDRARILAFEEAVLAKRGNFLTFIQSSVYMALVKNQKVTDKLIRAMGGNGPQLPTTEMLLHAEAFSQEKDAWRWILDDTRSNAASTGIGVDDSILEAATANRYGAVIAMLSRFRDRVPTIEHKLAMEMVRRLTWALQWSTKEQKTSAAHFLKSWEGRFTKEVKQQVLEEMMMLHDHRTVVLGFEFLLDLWDGFDYKKLTIKATTSPHMIKILHQLLRKTRESPRMVESIFTVIFNLVPDSRAQKTMEALGEEIFMNRFGWFFTTEVKDHMWRTKRFNPRTWILESENGFYEKHYSHEDLDYGYESDW
ncbi:heterokaryon incompatibility protein-domain-containing protein [Cladorrhinum sp. PSN259]|nr:heterokaryon incompatibility protein-domain-containing protein [Cladorrhinum sp. PSN259]